VYAVVRAAGRQYRVAEGDTIAVPGLAAEKGSRVELDVIAYADDDGVRVGTPRLEGVSVAAEVTGVAKGPKIDVLRYKSKVRHRKRRGHRERLTALRVTTIDVTKES
jgi:large subunit ribosomal protein L21